MNAIFKTLDEFQTELHAMGPHPQAYWDKQVHRVPRSISVDRMHWLVMACTGKTVLHIGCTGPLDPALCRVARRCYGIDRRPLDRPDYRSCDLDHLGDAGLPRFDGVDLIICGEILEHLSNPGAFLDALHTAYPGVSVIITAPNAFSLGGVSWLVQRGRENVNKDHVAYYSYQTLKTLLSRHGYQMTGHYWYNGKAYVSEGLIVLARPV